jgi:hypothetical protein
MESSIPRPQASTLWHIISRSRPRDWPARVYEWLRDDSTYGMSGIRALGTIAVMSVIGSLLCLVLFYIRWDEPLLPASTGESAIRLLVLAWPGSQLALAIGSVLMAACVLPVAAWLLRGRRLVGTFMIVLAVALSTITLLAPFGVGATLPICYLAVTAAFMACRRLPGLGRSNRNASE